LALVFAVGASIALGLVEEVVFFRKRRSQDKDDAAATEATASS
jgi:hypothetical protein